MALLKIEKLPTLKKVQESTAEIERNLKRLRDACVAFSHQEKLAAAENEFVSAKTVPEMERASTQLVLLTSQSAAAQRVSQRHAEIEELRRADAWRGVSGLIEAALAETEAALKTRLREIEGEDSQRSQELGFPVRSNEILAVIHKRLEKIGEGRAAIRAGNAIAAKGFLGQAAEAVI
ncbi:MAG: hypothetical protein WCA95_05090 [Opitutaceae bacterium]